MNCEHLESKRERKRDKLKEQRISQDLFIEKF